MLENRLFQVYGFHHNDFWSSFETNLGEITTEAILEGYVYAPMMMFIHSINEEEPIVLNMDDYTEQVGEIGYTLERLYNDLQLAFSNWIFQLENANPMRKVRIDKNNSAFINFNYTQTLENLYTKGILDMNPKDYINGTNSNAQIKPKTEVFLPDSRFETVDGNYMRREIEKDIFQRNNDITPSQTPNNLLLNNENSNNHKFTKAMSNFISSKFTAGAIATFAFILSGRYILKKLHILK